MWLLQLSNFWKTKPMKTWRINKIHIAAVSKQLLVLTYMYVLVYWSLWAVHVHLCVCVCVCLAVKSIEYPQNSCNLCETFIELNILLHKPYSKKFLVLRYCKTWQVQVLHCKECIIKYDQQKLQKRKRSRIFST